MPIQELRVHGVSGTPPRDILYTDPVTFTPPERATKIYVPRPRDPCFDTSAFHWANLTSGSRLTALWILLSPYALANAAGWMAGWKKDPLSPMGFPPELAPWHAKLGRMAIRAAGMAITALFIVEAITAVVVLPLAWLAQSGVVRIGPIEISLRWMSQPLGMTVSLAALGALVYWLVANVSTKSHFDEVSETSVGDLILEPSGEAMRRTREQKLSPEAAASVTEDPAGAPIVDPRLWTVHPMLHRLRRLHFGVCFGVLGAVILSMTGQIYPGVTLALIFALVFLTSWMTTYRPEDRWVWVVTSWVPIASLAVFVAAVGSIWLVDVANWNADSIHGLTFGVAVILGVFVALSLAAGPLSAGALVLATFFGAILGATIGLLTDKALHTDVLVKQGVGWVSVMMLALIAWLVLVAIGIAVFGGRSNPALGATSPLPKGFTPKAFNLIRRIALEARVLFYAAGLFGLGSFAYALVAVWRFGVAQQPNADFWSTMEAGLSPQALNQFPNGLVNVGITIGLLGPGYFMVRSLFTGWRGGVRGEDRRRKVGILWDLGSFWPRWFHPLAPPGYGPRAVKDLSEQLKAAPDNLVLAAHSQGSLIAAVTIARDRRPTRLITYGSQLGILYPRMFPAAGIVDLVDQVAGLCPTWINLWRDTDFIGGHFISRPGVDNRRVVEGAGHSGYELTGDYSIARRELADLGFGPCLDQR